MISNKYNNCPVGDRGVSHRDTASRGYAFVRES